VVSVIGSDNFDHDEAVANFHLTIWFPAVGDVESTRFEIAPVNCATGSAEGAAMVFVRALEDGTIPGGIGELENHPLDEDSAHRFADLFSTVDAGCYDIVATPLDAASAPSAVCAAASKKAVAVFAGKTTEIFLLNQCDGEDSGNVDILAALNTAPHIQSIHFEKSKFATYHESQVVARRSAIPRVIRSISCGRFQIATALIAADITPIFAVTADVVPTYQALSDQLTALGVRPVRVVVLTSDSSNIVDALLSGLDCK
jgi:hypothetical protein